MAQAGELATLEIGTVAGTLTAVTGITSMSFGAITQDPVEDFTLGSTSKTSRPSRLPDFGSLTVSLYYDSDNVQHKLLRDSSKNAATLYAEVTTDDGQTAVISGFVTSFEQSGMEVDSNVTTDVELKINTLTFTDAA